MNLDKILQESIEIVREVGKFIDAEQTKLTNDKVETKNIHNFVTYVDKNAEKQLVEKLGKLLPEAGFLTEEKTTTRKGDKYNWIIDPLDGTTNYIHGLRPVAISVALQRNDKTILGIVHEIGLNETFYAIENKQAQLNGKDIYVTDTQNIADALVATGFPYYDYDKLPEFMQTLEYFMQNSHGLRRLGSAATDLAYVACGRFEAFYEYSLSPWDVAAGAFIVEQAGGKVCDFSGGNNYIYGREIIATNSKIFNVFLHEIKKMMK